MAKSTEFFKIAPNNRDRTSFYNVKTLKTSNSNVDMYSVSSYSAQGIKNQLKMAMNRVANYNLYDQMDRDIDISRALDTLADEMTPMNDETNLPFSPHYMNDIGEEVDENIIITVKSALTSWVNFYDLHRRVWQIARTVAKTGDVFFLRVPSENGPRKWKYIPAKDVVGIAVDKNTNEIKGYQLRADSKYLTKNLKTMVQNTMNQQLVIDKDDMVHFSISDETRDTYPFGSSVLSTVYRTFKQLELLEDSVIIYRIVRAPERRAFYIDTGKNNPIKSRKIVEKFMNDLRQKRIPSRLDDKFGVDSAYNPESMIEDFFMAAPAEGRGSKVEILSGGQNLGELDDLWYFQDKLFRGLRIPISYMVNSRNAEGATVQDGRVGTAYIQELRFTRYIMRLQEMLNATFDREFKNYMKNEGFNIDDGLFKLKFNTPQNFKIYKDIELATDTLNTLHTAMDVPFISKKYALMKYMNWSEEDIQTNEILLKKERGINGPVRKEIKDESGNVISVEEFDEDRQIYDSKFNEG